MEEKEGGKFEKRIEFLKPTLDGKVLRKCLEGDEESLCEAKLFLMNNGWWEEANNILISNIAYLGTTGDGEMLINLIMQKWEFVHPNIIRLVKAGDEEGIRMALNNIHYGTFKLSRKMKKLHKMAKPNGHNMHNLEKEASRKKKYIGRFVVNNNKMDESKRQIEKEFIRKYAHLNDGWILRETTNGIDFYVNHAIYQIHATSIGSNTHIGQPDFSDLFLKKFW
ncbi:hypothetical protein AgCh_032551 [Apium graveolens]